MQGGGGVDEHIRRFRSAIYCVHVSGDPSSKAWQNAHDYLHSFGNSPVAWRVSCQALQAGPQVDNGLPFFVAATVLRSLVRTTWLDAPMPARQAAAQAAARALQYCGQTAAADALRGASGPQAQQASQPQTAPVPVSHQSEERACLLAASVVVQLLAWNPPTEAPGAGSLPAEVHAAQSFLRTMCTGLAGQHGPSTARVAARVLRYCPEEAQDVTLQARAFAKSAQRAALQADRSSQAGAQAAASGAARSRRAVALEQAGAWLRRGCLAAVASHAPRLAARGSGGARGSPAAAASEEALGCLSAWAEWTAHHEGRALRLRPEDLLAADREEEEAARALAQTGGSGGPGPLVPRLYAVLNCLAARCDSVAQAATEATLCLVQQQPVMGPSLETVLAAPGRGEQAKRAAVSQARAARRSCQASRALAMGLRQLEAPWKAWCSAGEATIGSIDAAEQGAVRCRCVVQVVSALAVYHQDTLLSAVGVRKAETALLVAEGCSPAEAQRKGQRAQEAAANETGAVLLQWLGRAISHPRSGVSMRCLQAWHESLQCLHRAPDALKQRMLRVGVDRQLLRSIARLLARHEASRLHPNSRRGPGGAWLGRQHGWARADGVRQLLRAAQETGPVDGERDPSASPAAALRSLEAGGWQSDASGLDSEDDDDGEVGDEETGGVKSDAGRQGGSGPWATAQGAGWQQQHPQQQQQQLRGPAAAAAATPASKGQAAVAGALGLDAGAGLVGGDALEWAVGEDADGRSEDSGTSGGSGSGSGAGAGMGAGGGLSVDAGVQSAALDSNSVRLALDVLQPLVSSWPGPLRASLGLAEELQAAAREADRVLGVAAEAARRRASGAHGAVAPGQLAAVRSAGAVAVSRCAWLVAMAQRAASQWVFQEYECAEDGEDEDGVGGGFDSDSDGEAGAGIGPGVGADRALEGGSAARWWAAGAGAGAGAQAGGAGRCPGGIVARPTPGGFGGGGFVSASALMDRPGLQREAPTASSGDGKSAAGGSKGPFDEREGTRAWVACLEMASRCHRASQALLGLGPANAGGAVLPSALRCAGSQDQAARLGSFLAKETCSLVAEAAPLLARRGAAMAAVDAPSPGVAPAPYAGAPASVLAGRGLGLLADGVCAAACTAGLYLVQGAQQSISGLGMAVADYGSGIKPGLLRQVLGQLPGCSGSPSAASALSVLAMSGMCGLLGRRGAAAREEASGFVDVGMLAGGRGGSARTRTVPGMLGRDVTGSQWCKGYRQLNPWALVNRACTSSAWGGVQRAPVRHLEQAAGALQTCMEGIAVSLARGAMGRLRGRGAGPSATGVRAVGAACGRLAERLAGLLALLLCDRGEEAGKPASTGVSLESVRATVRLEGLGQAHLCAGEMLLCLYADSVARVASAACAAASLAHCLEDGGRPAARVKLTGRLQAVVKPVLRLIARATREASSPGSAGGGARTLQPCPWARARVEAGLIVLAACLAGVKAPCHRAEDGAWRRLAVLGGLETGAKESLPSAFGMDPLAGVLLQAVWPTCAGAAGSWGRDAGAEGAAAPDPVGSVRAAALQLARLGVMSARGSIGPMLEPVLRALVSAAEDSLGVPVGGRARGSGAGGPPPATSFASRHSSTLLREAIGALEGVVEGAAGNKGQEGAMPVRQVAGALDRVLVPLLLRWAEHGTGVLRAVARAARGETSDVPGAMQAGERGLRGEAALCRHELVTATCRLLNAVCIACPAALVLPLDAAVLPREGAAWAQCIEMVRAAAALGEASPVAGGSASLGAAMRRSVGAGERESPWACARAGLAEGGGRVCLLLPAVCGLVSVLVLGGEQVGAQALHKAAGALRHMGEAQGRVRASEGTGGGPVAGVERVAGAAGMISAAVVGGIAGVASARLASRAHGRGGEGEGEGTRPGLGSMRLERPSAAMLCQATWIWCCLPPREGSGEETRASARTGAGAGEGGLPMPPRSRGSLLGAFAAVGDGNSAGQGGRCTGRVNVSGGGEESAAGAPCPVWHLAQRAAGAAVLPVAMGRAAGYQAGPVVEAAHGVGRAALCCGGGNTDWGVALSALLTGERDGGDLGPPPRSRLFGAGGGFVGSGSGGMRLFGAGESGTGSDGNSQRSGGLVDIMGEENRRGGGDGKGSSVGGVPPSAAGLGSGSWRSAGPSWYLPALPAPVTKYKIRHLGNHG